MIDRARVYVHQTNALIMFVCLFYFCNIHNQFDHHLHTYTIEINFCFIFSDYNRHLRNNRVMMIQKRRSDFVLSFIEYRLYKTCRSLLTQVDSCGGHWHLLEDHYDTHVKQHACIQNSLQKSKILFLCFLLLMMDSLQIITVSVLTFLLQIWSIEFVLPLFIYKVFIELAELLKNYVSFWEDYSWLNMCV
jgi:hypothetical protein